MPQFDLIRGVGYNYSMIKRAVDIEANLRENKILIIYGARQVGKTTLVKDYLTKTKYKYLFYTGDDLNFSDNFAKCDLPLFRKMFTGTELLVIDEAQKIPNIGRALKLVVDNFEKIRVIATGSSSFDLANVAEESLTGRKNILNIYPIAQDELIPLGTQNEIENNLPDYLIYGSYPAVITADTLVEKERIIREIENSYLLKDILSFDMVKSSKTIRDLLKLVAFQIGQEVSLTELGSNLDIDKKTVARYLDLLEKAFVLFRRDGFARNLRKEVSKMSKYYFYDNGIRNALISNFNDIDTRNDIGILWENFLTVERMKRNEYSNSHPNYYFWRTYDQKEIDLIEEIGGELNGYEFKWTNKTTGSKKEWLDAYKNAHLEIINRDNYFEFLKYTKA
jgi:predicted AAA+ superfamily ATPase